jgi:hypothetical protein
MTTLLRKGSGKLARREVRLLSDGTEKTGEEIYAFNLPPVDTCPGMSAGCSFCYARRSRWKFTQVQRALYRNWEATRDPFFAERLIREIRRRRVKIVRIHASGDFPTAHYIRCWAQVSRGCPGTRLYAYTRSWRLPGLRPWLEELAVLPNVRLWYSADTDTGMPRRLPEGVRVAWLQLDADEVLPAGVDLVFRNHPLRRRRMKRVGLTLVCPTEQGQHNHTGTCANCGLCWK